MGRQGFVRIGGIGRARAAAISGARRMTVTLPLRIAAALVVVALSAALLRDRLAAVDPGRIWSAVAAIGGAEWALAGAAALISFLAAGRYDGLVHRHLGTDVPQAAARHAGMAAIAVGQTLGLGVVTGALVRWRLLPGLTLWQATRVSATVALFFFAGWFAVTAVAVTADPLGGAGMAGLAGVALAGAVLLAAFLQPRPLRRLGLPNGFTATALAAWAAVDTVFAGIALYVLLPAGTAPDLPVFLPAFLLAFGAGLLSGTPAGLGAFEVALLAGLPAADGPALMAAVVGWRIVYYALPALAGGAVALAGPRPSRRVAVPVAAPSTRPIDPALRAEGGLVRQGELGLWRTSRGAAFVAGRTPHALVMVLDPVHGAGGAGQTLADLAAAARAEGRIPALYKITARTAAKARRAGFRTVAIAREAVVDPAHFALSAPAAAPLRRKLRHAARAGVAVTRTTGRPETALHAIATLWANRHGGERGFSMGRFCPDYLTGQRLYVARVAGMPVAFASFHEGAGEWTLDLMRHGEGVPDGTMHALVAAAIADAAAAGVPRLSLAAVPIGARPDDRAGARRGLAHRLTRHAGRRAEGLARFKAAFAPRWQTLYLAAPGPGALALAAAEIARAVLRPDPLPATGDVLARAGNDEYEFATGRRSWQRET